MNLPLLVIFFPQQDILRPIEFIWPIHRVSNFLHFILEISPHKENTQTSHIWLHVKGKLLKKLFKYLINFFFLTHGGLSLLPA